MIAGSLNVEKNPPAANMQTENWSISYQNTDLSLFAGNRVGVPQRFPYLAPFIAMLLWFVRTISNLLERMFHSASDVHCLPE
jgi:hypothetical protein